MKDHPPDQPVGHFSVEMKGKSSGGTAVAALDVQCPSSTAGVKRKEEKEKLPRIFWHLESKEKKKENYS